MKVRHLLISGVALCAMWVAQPSYAYRQGNASASRSTSVQKSGGRYHHTNGRHSSTIRKGSHAAPSRRPSTVTRPSYHPSTKPPTVHYHRRPTPSRQPAVSKRPISPGRSGYWRAGQYVPKSYFQRYAPPSHVRRHYAAPPRGYDYVYHHGELLLVALTTGLIVNVLAGY
jgi:Ni/Co efflux regulator RcnB